MRAKRHASLRRRYPRRIDIPVLLTLSAALIGLGLMLPAVETRALVWRDEYSILLNIKQLSREGKQTAAAILTLCSIGYPVIKFTLLGFFWLFPFPPSWRWRSIQLIRLLGRWAMVDVLAMTSIVVASVTIGPLHATPRIGLFLFAAGILCLGAAGYLMDRLARTR